MPEIAKIDPSSINSPLALIALFVAMIELFLLFPITKLQGRDRSLLVYFIIGYPIFIAASFFVFLWFKPINLYTPQTLSENLQRALLPESLKFDRVDVAAIEVKVSQLEFQLHDVSQKIGGGAASALPADVAKLSDLDNLKRDLLARAEAAGDVSRAGLASAAKEIRDSQTQTLNERAAAATAQLKKFNAWLKQLGLAVTADLPSVSNFLEQANGPYLVGNSITLGPANQDYFVPGLYINAIAQKLNVRTEVSDGTFHLVWTSADYMVSKFADTKFPNPDGPFSATSKTVPATKGYKISYKLFVDLADTFGDKVVEAGIVRMINEWNSASTLSSSLKSLATGMSNAGVSKEKASAILEKAEDQFASLTAAN